MELYNWKDVWSVEQENLIFKLSGAALVMLWNAAASEEKITTRQKNCQLSIPSLKDKEPAALSQNEEREMQPSAGVLGNWAKEYFNIWIYVKPKKWGMR